MRFLFPHALFHFPSQSSGIDLIQSYLFLLQPSCHELTSMVDQLDYNMSAHVASPIQRWARATCAVAKICAGTFARQLPTRGICLNIHTHKHTHTHTSFQLKPSCYASVMGRSATASAMKDNIIKLDVSSGKANSLSTVIRVMHWHSPPRGRFNCVQTRTHTLTCKQTHTPPRTFRVCVCVCVCDAAVGWFTE